MTTAYRSEETILYARREVLLAERMRHAAAIAALLERASVHAARRLAGTLGVGTLAFVASAALGVFLLRYDTFRFRGVDGAEAGGLITLMAVVIPALTALVASSGQLARSLIARGALTSYLAPTRDVRADVMRLETGSDLRALGERVTARSESSVSLLFVTAAIFLPLLLHLGVWTVVGLVSSPALFSSRWLSDFDRWVVLSAGLMALSYLVLIVRVLRFRHRVRTVPTADLKRFGMSYGFATLGLTSLAACVPGAMLMFIPPVVSFVTGLLVLPALFSLYGAVLADERDRVGTAFQAALSQ